MFFKRRSTVSTTAMTYLGVGSEFDGDLKTNGGLRVDGAVRGNVNAQGDVEVSANGSIEGAELRGKNIIVFGRIKARLIADGKLTLSSTAHLEGDVVAHSLQIDEGAYYVGYISTKEDEAPSALPPAATDNFQLLEVAEPQAQVRESL